MWFGRRVWVHHVSFEADVGAEALAVEELGFVGCEMGRFGVEW